MFNRNKFRAWDKELGVYNHDTVPGNLLCDIHQGSITPEDTERFILEQSVGFDGLVSDLYENDRVSTLHFGIGTIVWYDYGWCIKLDKGTKTGDYARLSCIVEVVGTTHGN